MKKLLLFLMFFMSVTSYLLAQSAVTGKVTDENGDGIPGANIIIKGTDSGDATDLTGSFTITVQEAGTYEVIASAISYESESQIITLEEGKSKEIKGN